MPIAALLLAPVLTSQLTGPGRRGEVIARRASASVVIDNQRLDGGVVVSGANRVLVEMRPVFERLGARVNWDANQLKVSAFTPQRGIEMAINSNIIFIGGKKTTMDSPPVLRDGKVFVPLRAVSQAFGAMVKWDGGTRTARIMTSKTMPRNDPTGVDQGGAGLGAPQEGRGNTTGGSTGG